MLTWKRTGKDLSLVVVGTLLVLLFLRGKKKKVSKGQSKERERKKSGLFSTMLLLRVQKLSLPFVTEQTMVTELVKYYF